MSQAAIVADRLSKAYRIAGDGSYRTLRDAIVSAARHPIELLRRQEDTLWAVEDVSFTVDHGQALGIIGRNGAGKSTLLKLLSRITRPTRGRADVYGRLGSLLEVGTGFHPELTGRENVFLNGAILGMSRREIARRFDEIIDFAETERFVDVPVKRYSSGMQMRLAFAVAAHLDADILVIDEVLAVGDAAFQEKCFGKMGDVTAQGRTVLFVSHNMAAVAQLCDSAILLETGRVRAAGPVQEVIGTYLSDAREVGSVDLRDRSRRRGSGVAAFEWAEIRDGTGALREDFFLGDDLVARFGMRFAEPGMRTKLAVSIRASDGLPIAHITDDDSAFALPPSELGATVEARFDDLRLYPGTYYLTLWSMDPGNTTIYDVAEDCVSFRIVDGGRLTLRPLPRHSGIVFLTPAWRSRAEGGSGASGPS